VTLNIVSLTLLAWIPVCAGLFMFFRPVRALMLAYLIGWLLLPVDALEIKGFWDVDKILATNFGVVLGTICFCPKRLAGLRFGVPEFILLAHALSAVVTSLSNQLGLYDGISSFVYRVLYTAVPFCFGRAFVRTREELDEAARLVVSAAAAYALLALWEWRMSPQIHKLLYGYFQHSFAQHMRWGFFRPIVCFSHALGLGTFFAWTSLLALVMYRAGRFRPVLGISPIVYAALPLLALLASMSIGPWWLFAFGLALYAFRARQRWRWTLWLPVILAVGWMGGRYTGVLDGTWTDAAVRKFSPQRADSLLTRINSETATLDHAAQRPVFGWGGFGRGRAVDDRGREIVTDGMWIILIGTFGIAGVATFYLWWCWPIVMTRKAWVWLGDDPVVFPILIAIGMQAVNLIFNGFLSPILTVVAGMAVTALYAMRRPAPRTVPAAHLQPAPSLHPRGVML